METLYCPKCGYNLTGLTRNVCPECGNAFDPAEVADRQAQRRPRFIFWTLLLLLAPALMFFIPFVIDNYANLAVIWVAFGLVCLISSYTAGRRVARRLARKYPDDPPTPATIGIAILFACIFLVCQLALGIAFYFASIFLVGVGFAAAQGLGVVF